MNSSKHSVLAYPGQFRMLLVTYFGFRCDPNVSGTSGVRLRGTRQNSQFWPIPASFLCYYSLISGPAAIRTSREPRCPITWNSSKHPVLAYSEYFCMHSLIFGPAAIRKFREPSGPVTENSSKIVILAYSRMFCKLLLTDFCSRCDPNVLGTPGSGYGELVKTRTFGLLRPIFYAISH